MKARSPVTQKETGAAGTGTVFLLRPLRRWTVLFLGFVILGLSTSALRARYRRVSDAADAMACAACVACATLASAGIHDPAHFLPAP